MKKKIDYLDLFLFILALSFTIYDMGEYSEKGYVHLKSDYSGNEGLAAIFWSILMTITFGYSFLRKYFEKEATVNDNSESSRWKVEKEKNDL